MGTEWDSAEVGGLHMVVVAKMFSGPARCLCCSWEPQCGNKEGRARLWEGPGKH